MAVFEYVAKDINDQIVKNVAEASSPRSLAMMLKQQQLRPQSIDLYKPQKKLRLFTGVSMTDKVFFYKQMNLMLGSGISLGQSLKIIADLSSGELSQVAKKLHKHISAGKALSKTMTKFPRVFDVLEVYMIKCAELTGHMDQICLRLAENLQKKNQLKKQIKMSMIYPSVIFVLAIGMFFLLALVVIPKLVEFIEKLGRQIPPITQLMIDVSDFMRMWSLPLLMLIALSIIAVLMMRKRSVEVKYSTDQWLLKMPIFGPIIQLGAMTQISWVMSMLIKSGITVIQSLQVVEKLLPNAVHKKAINIAEQKVSAGLSVGVAMSQPVFDRLLSELVVIGEKSGNLDDILQEAAAHYQERLELKGKMLATLIEPFAIIVVAGQVAFVYIGFILSLVSATGGQ